MFKEIYSIIVDNQNVKMRSTQCAENEKEAIDEFKKEYEKYILEYQIKDSEIKVKEFISMGYEMIVS